MQKAEEETSFNYHKKKVLAFSSVHGCYLSVPNVYELEVSSLHCTEYCQIPIFSVSEKCILI